MPKLIVIEPEDRSGQEFLLDKRRMTVGRRPNNDICIPDTIVSGAHAQFEISGDGVILEDLGSTNGTGVNGKRVVRVKLSEGDEIRFGRFKLRFQDAGPEANSLSSRSFPGAEKTQILRAWEGAEGPQGFLKVLSGDGSGDVLDLRKPFTAVGKIGDQVALVTRRQDGYGVRAVSASPNPPRLNGKALGTETSPLHDGDVIEVAGQRFEFFFTTQMGSS